VAMGGEVMAQLPDWTKEQDASHVEWLAGRPPVIQALAARVPPDRLYRLESTGHRVYLYSYSEDETVTVVVAGQFNVVAFERKVFGIKPEELEECDLPDPEEPMGSFDFPTPLLKQLFRGEIGAICVPCKGVWTDECDRLDHYPYTIDLRGRDSAPHEENNA